MAIDSRRHPSFDIGRREPRGQGLTASRHTSRACIMSLIGLGDEITERLVGTAVIDAGNKRFRRRRWRALADRFPLSEMTVLDVGGVEAQWRLSPAKPARLVMLNLFPQESEAEVIVGDACDPPEALLREHFDLVISNSVLEHVGGHWRRQRFAETVHAISDHHWVQTPYRYFPIEPHFVCPGVQYLPKRVAVTYLSNWPIGNYRGKLRDPRRTLEYLQRIELLDLSSFRTYFPDSEIVRERIGPLIKSLIAVR
jgi:hypothetical protein